MPSLLVVIISCSQLLIFQIHVATPTFKVDTVTISTDELGSCLSAENREITLLSIRSNISVILLGQTAVQLPQCGDGLWYRVAYLNMNDSTQQCPPNWTEINAPVRACSQPTTTTASCSSEYFSTGDFQYSRVCGRAVGYQYGSADAFKRFGGQQTIDHPYVDGVSVTYGMPRTHIWTFAVGNSEARVANYMTNCPCANTSALTTSAPSFVGNNYFCESGNPGEGLGSDHGGITFENDPLWDGEQCEGECCSNGKSPPWFSVTLPNPTSDDIEVRICGDEGTSNENFPIQLFEIYIQ